MSTNQHNAKSEGNIALCYIRPSICASENDQDSVNEQRALIEQCVEAKGWAAEWYIETQGGKSERTGAGRPGWQKLERRLGDPDVVALVAYDPYRLHRKVWRIGNLLEKVDTFQIQLVFVAPDFNMDTTTPWGRSMLQMMVMMDEAYANDVALRTKAAREYHGRQAKMETSD